MKIEELQLKKMMRMRRSARVWRLGQEVMENGGKEQKYQKMKELEFGDERKEEGRKCITE